jgi:hypothetical protein
VNRRGVKIDVEAVPSAAGIAAGRHEALETALRIINGQGGS